MTNMKEEMESTKKDVVDIFGKCGIVENIVESMNINEGIRRLEDEARKNRPPTAGKRAPLTNFLSNNKARELEGLRKDKSDLKVREEKSFDCASTQIKEKGIKFIRTKKGTFVTK